MFSSPTAARTSTIRCATRAAPGLLPEGSRLPWKSLVCITVKLIGSAAATGPAVAMTGTASPASAARTSVVRLVDVDESPG